MGSQSCGTPVVHVEVSRHCVQHNAVIPLGGVAADVAGNNVGKNGLGIALQGIPPTGAATAADQNAVSCL